MMNSKNVFIKNVEFSIKTDKKWVTEKQDLMLFTIKLSSYHDKVDDFMKFLLPDEVRRAERYYSIKDKNRFIICRTLLKLILSAVTDLKVLEILFEKDSNKKPYLPSHKNIYFNVSHSEDYAIIAISNSKVGVDVEYVNDQFDFSDILAHVFSNLEIDTILDAKDKKLAFYNFWTRKEAFVKATGQGITTSLPQIPSINGHHSIAPTLLGDIQNLKVLSFNIAEDYVASIALVGENAAPERISIYNLPTSMEELMLLNNKN